MSPVLRAAVDALLTGGSTEWALLSAAKTLLKNLFNWVKLELSQKMY